MVLGTSASGDNCPYPSEELRSAFVRDGFVTLRAFFSSGEVQRLIANCCSNRLQPEGSQLLPRRDPASEEQDVTDLHERICQLVKALLGENVRHVHSKLLDEKEAKLGGSWPWHQDYWYAYQCGFLFPDMANTVVALHRTTTENGALQVMKGSHKMGRLDHVLLNPKGERRDGPVAASEPVWIGADPVRVQQAVAVLEVVDCVMDPGDVLVFHANSLHRSGQTCSLHDGRALLCSCYRAAWNEQVEQTSVSGLQIA
jgi:ectoine hydroxylase-related dioxygenase (phytanoyl-CoA dioxygenase family)